MTDHNTLHPNWKKISTARMYWSQAFGECVLDEVGCGVAKDVVQSASPTEIFAKENQIFLNELTDLYVEIKTFVQNTPSFETENAILGIASQVASILQDFREDVSNLGIISLNTMEKVVGFYRSQVRWLMDGKRLTIGDEYWNVDRSDFPTPNSRMVTTFCSIDLPFQNHLLEKSKIAWKEEVNKARGRIEHEMIGPTEQRRFDDFYKTQIDRRLVLLGMIDLVQQGRRHEAVLLGARHNTI